MYKKYRWKLFIIVGILLAGFAITKWIVENLGMAKINMFGLIQALALGFGLVFICAGLIFKPGSRENDFRLFREFLFILFVTAILAHLPILINKADVSDEKYVQTIKTDTDDLEYQILAVNLLHGFGFNDGINLPIDEYHLDLSTPWGKQTLETYEDNPTALRDRYAFYRAPGFPLMLAGTYALFGNTTIVARYLLVTIAMMTALILLIMGTYWAGWIGTIAGGLVGIYYLDFQPGLFDFESILTEGPATFWVAVFSLTFFIYLKKRTSIWLYLSALWLSFIILVRANWLVALPLFLIYLWLKKIQLRQLLVFGLIAILPLALWSGYASIMMDKPVMLTTQGGDSFPEYNNMDVLEGIGPDHSGQGGWMPGREYDEQGRIIRDRNGVEPGENGYIKGLTFWRDHIFQLPKLFFVKLQRGFWYGNSWSVNPLRPEGFHLIGIAYLLMALGLRKVPRKSHILPTLSSGNVILLQLGFISLLFLFWNQVSFVAVHIIWLLMAFFAIFRPYGDTYQLPYLSPAWFFTFILAHFVTTILYAGYRFHWPLDPVLMIFSFTGIFLTIFELSKRKLLSAVPFLLVILVSMTRYYVFQ